MKQQISSQQFFAILWAALMSPAAELLPAVTVPVAGRGAWIGILLAAPVMALLGAVLFRVSRKAQGGLAEVAMSALGSILGRAVILLYIVWGIFLLALRMRLCAQRLMDAGYQDSAMWFLVVIVAGMALWMSLGKLPAFGRTTQVFFGVLVIVVVLVVGLAAPQVRTENLLPLWKEDMMPAIRSALPSLGCLSYGVFAAFLVGNTCWEEGDGKRWLWWTALGCIALALMQLVVIGNFGPGLVEKLDKPFFDLAKSIGVKGAFQRVESVIAAVWTFSDLVILGLLLRAVSTGARTAFPKGGGRAVSAMALVPAAVCALALFPDGITPQSLSRGPVLWVGVMLGGGLPLLIAAIAEFRQKRK